MRIGELLAFILYFVAMLGIGFFFMLKRKTDNQEGYFLGGRKMGPFVTAMSAQASDMSGWLLMGLPGVALAGSIDVTIILGTPSQTRVVDSLSYFFIIESRSTGPSATVCGFFLNNDISFSFLKI